MLLNTKTKMINFDFDAYIQHKARLLIENIKELNKMALSPIQPQDNSISERDRYRNDLAMKEADPSRYNAHNGTREISPEQMRVIEKLESHIISQDKICNERHKWNGSDRRSL